MDLPGCARRAFSNIVTDSREPEIVNPRPR
jgi:hypothetical protein